MFKALMLYGMTAVFEILGCYLPYLWFKQGYSAWLLVPGLASLGMFVWLLMLHDAPAARVYAAYGGIYVTIALLLLWITDGAKMTRWDMIGVGVILLGAIIIIAQPQQLHE